MRLGSLMRIRENINFGRVLVLLLCFIVVGQVYFVTYSYAEPQTKTMTVNFSESSARSRSKTVTIPNLQNVVGVKVDTGNVNFSVSGENITVNTSGGSYSSRSYSSRKYSKTVSDSRTSSSSSFPSTISYDSGGYSGTLSKSGSANSRVVSGSPADSKTVTDSISVTSKTYDEWSASRSRWVFVEYWRSNDPKTITYKDGTYSGTLQRSVTTNQQYKTYTYPSDPYDGQIFIRKTGSWTRHYSGKVTKPDTRVYEYTQNYNGRVYKGGYNYYYKYTVTIEYLDNQVPNVSISQPTENEYFGKKEGHNNILLEGKVNDDDIGDEITVKYTLHHIDSATNLAGHTDVEIFNVSTSDGTDKSFNHSITIDETMPSGKYELRIIAQDDKGGKGKKVVPLNIDNTPPQTNLPTVNAVSDTEIEIIPNAIDTSGLHTTETYIYNRDNTDLTEYVSESLYKDTELTANTQYTYKYKAKDILDNESDYSDPVSKYTLALDPTDVDVIAKTSDSITFDITNTHQGNIPETRLEVKEKRAGIDGEVKSVSEWSTETVREINGLSENTEYELWIQTRNGDQIANDKYCAVESIRTNIAPSLSIERVDSKIYSEINGHNMILVTGNFKDEDPGDKLSLWLEIGNSDIPLDITETFNNIEAGQDNHFDIEIYFLSDADYEAVDTADTSGFSATTNGAVTIGEQNTSCKVFKEDAPAGNQRFRVYLKNVPEGTSEDHTLKVFGKDDKGGVTNKLGIFKGDEAGFTIDKTAPIFTNITSPNDDGLYKEGDTIEINVTLSENSLVNTIEGKPTLTLDSEGTAVYTGAEGENTSLLFTYVVGPDEDSNDLSVTGINLRGGTITDKYGNPIDIIWDNLLPGENTNLNDNSEIVIDTTPAVIEKVTSSKDDGVYKEGEEIQIEIQFSEVVNIIGSSTLNLNSGGSAHYSSGSGTDTLYFDYTVGKEDNSDDLNYASMDSLVLHEDTSIKDKAGNNAIITLPDLDNENSLGSLKDIIIDNIPPIVNNIDYSIDTKKVTFDLTDTGAGLKELKYFFSDIEKLEMDFDTYYDNVEGSKETIDLSHEGANVVKETIINAKDKRYIHFKVKDKLDNEAISFKGLNQPPKLIISTVEEIINLDYNSEFILTGSVTDEDKDIVTITAVIGEIEKTMDIDTSADSNWSLTWKGSELKSGLFEGITINADDGKGGYDTEKWNGSIAINPYIRLNGNNLVEIERENRFIDPGTSSNYLVKVTGTVDTSKLGKYVLTYEAENPVGTVARANRTIVVIKNLKDRIRDKIDDINKELDDLENTKESNLPRDIEDLNKSIDELEDQINELPEGKEKDDFIDELEKIKERRDKLQEKVNNKDYFEDKIDKIYIDFERDP
ncbi:immunoglobulin-like domain-containing protein, partial [Maledivibacter halophilus]